MKDFEKILMDRNDAIANAAYQLAVELVRGNQICTDEKIIPWDMSYIGEIIGAAEEELQKRGYKTCNPYYCDEGQIPCPESGTCDNPTCPYSEA